MNDRTKHAGRLAPLAAAAVVAALNAMPQSALAVPITFGSAVSYDNTANVVNNGPTPVNNQTTGLFRDVFWYSINNGAPRVNSPDFINRGNSLVLVNNHAEPGSGPYTALNVTGPSISGGNSYLAVYDTTVGDGTTNRNLFSAEGPHLVLSTDILFVKHNTSGGLVALYSEGQDGLAVLANNRDGNNTDLPSVSIVFRDAGADIILTSANLAANSFVAGNWYRITMDLSVTGSAWSVTGTYNNHTDPTNPNSAVGSLISTLSVSGVLGNPSPSDSADGLRVLTNPGEIGLVAMGNELISLPDNVGISFTNFDIPSCIGCAPGGQQFEVPEPATIALLGGSLLGLGLMRRRRHKNG